MGLESFFCFISVGFHIFIYNRIHKQFPTIHYCCISNPHIAISSQLIIFIQLTPKLYFIYQSINNFYKTPKYSSVRKGNCPSLLLMVFYVSYHCWLFFVPPIHSHVFMSVFASISVLFIFNLMILISIPKIFSFQTSQCVEILVLNFLFISICETLFSNKEHLLF